LLLQPVSPHDFPFVKPNAVSGHIRTGGGKKDSNERKGKKTGERRNTDLSTAPDVTKTIEKHEYLLSTVTSSCLSYTEAKRNQDRRSRARQASIRK
jgi:hypothetical protein